MATVWVGRLAGSATLMVCALGATPRAWAAQDADLIVRNARIWTGDAERPFAAAVAIRGDRFVAVGTTAEMERHRGARTRTIDAGGRFVAPGFIDNHTHFER